MALGVAAAAALATGLWLACQRRPKATREQALVALKRLTEECTAALCEVSAAVSRVELPRRLLQKAQEGSSQDDPLEKLSSILSQPLVLGTALQRAALKAAEELPGRGSTAEDLEFELERYAEDPDFKIATDQLRASHAACLAGKHVPAAAAQVLWTDDELLLMLKALGEEKSNILKAALSSGGPQKASGPDLLRAACKAEEAVWQRLYPSDQQRRSSFSAALESKTWMDGGFQRRRATIEKELQKAADRLCS